MQCHLTWDTYKKNICNGFSDLQQREEFVDMTLAADGHIVKVHRNLVALASPYIKQMITSAACQHPVIFLNNVSNEILCYILEYIYTGEVRLPVEKINTFIEAAKSLHISGLEAVVYPVSAQKTEMAHKINEQRTPHGKKSLTRNISLAGTDHSIIKQLIVQNRPMNGNDLSDTEDTAIEKDNDVIDTTDNMHKDNDFVNLADDKVYNDIDLVDITNDIHVDNDVVDTTNGGDRIQVVLHENLESAMQSSSICTNGENEWEKKNDNFLNISALPIVFDQELKNESNIGNSIPTINITSNSETQSNRCFNYTLEITRSSAAKHNPVANTNIQDNLAHILINEQSILPHDDVDMNQNPGDNTNKNIQNALKPILTNNNNQRILPHDDIDINQNPGDNTNKNIQNALKPILTNNNNQHILPHDDVDMNQNPGDNMNIQDNVEHILSNNYTESIVTLDDIDMQIQKVQPAATTNNENLKEYDKLMAHGSHFNLETEKPITSDIRANAPLYGLSTKGSMQLIMNRYMYNMHHTSYGERKRRWRCIDYRLRKCKAYIDTDGEIIVERSFVHCHTFHDGKILKMGQRQMVYTSIEQVPRKDVEKKEKHLNYKE